MPDPTIEQTIEKLTQDYKSAKEAMEAIPGMGEKIGALTKSFEDLQAQVKIQAEKKSLLNEIGTSEEERKLAFGCLIKGLVAHELQQTRYIDNEQGRLNPKNEASCKKYGFVGTEAELATHMLEKAGTFGLASLDDAGGVFVSHDLIGDYIKKLRPSERVFFDAGMQYTEVPAGGGVFTIPVQKTLASATSVDESGQLVQTGLDWGIKQVTPHRIGNATLISRRLLFSAAKYEQIAIGELGYAVWREIQRQTMYGKGAQGEVAGLYGDSGVTKIYFGNGGATSAGSAGKILTYTDSNLMEDLLAQANGRIDGFSIIAQPQVIRNLKNSIINSNGTFNLVPEGTLTSDENLKKALGVDRKFFRLTDVTKGLTVGSSTDCSHVWFGQFDNAEVFTWGGPQFKVSAEAVVGGKSAFERNAMALAIDMNFDILHRQTAEVFVGVDARTASAV